MRLYGYFCIISVLLEMSKPSQGLQFLVSFTRHGARTPLKFDAQFSEFFPNIRSGQLTPSGWKQLYMLGMQARSSLRSSSSGKPFLNDVSSEFLLISSPVQRTFDSSLAFSAGFAPDHVYELTDKNTSPSFHPLSPRDYPPYKDIELVPFDTFTLLKEKHNPDTLFHPRKCFYSEDSINKAAEVEDSEPIANEEELQRISQFVRHKLPKIAEELNILDSPIKEEKVKTVFNGIYSVNYHFPGKIEVPSEIYLIMRKITVNVMFNKVLKNDYHAELAASHFFMILSDLIKTQLGEEKSISAIFGAELKEGLKYAAFIGHDYNLVAIARVLLSKAKLKEYLSNLEDDSTFEKIYFSYASHLEFRLVKLDSTQFIQILMNGREIFTELAGGIQYQKGKGIPVETFLSLLKSKIRPEIMKCISKKKK